MKIFVFIFTESFFTRFRIRPSICPLIEYRRPSAMSLFQIKDSIKDSFCACPLLAMSQCLGMRALPQIVFKQIQMKVTR